jgi:adenosylhomocysteine nucleosidase
LSAGFSGALRPEARVGHLVLATDVVNSAGQVWPVTWTPDVVFPRGRLLCMPELVADTGEKQRLGQCYQAIAVDMETATLARFCHAHRVPFGCLRVISDDLDTPLSPRLSTLLCGGQVSPLRLAAALLRRPALLIELWRLARSTRRAAWILAQGLRELLSQSCGCGAGSAGADKPH